MEELAEVFTADQWSDVNPNWPNEPILRFIPGTDSGTFDYFVEEVFDKDAEPILSAANTQLSEDDNILVQGIEGSPSAIGFFGYAYYDEAGDALKILDIEGVTANTANVDNGTYPLARPLFMYSDADDYAGKTACRRMARLCAQQRGRRHVGSRLLQGAGICYSGCQAEVAGRGRRYVLSRFRHRTT